MPCYGHASLQRFQDPALLGSSGRVDWRELPHLEIRHELSGNLGQDSLGQGLLRSLEEEKHTGRDISTVTGQDRSGTELPGYMNVRVSDMVMNKDMSFQTQSEDG